MFELKSDYFRIEISGNVLALTGFPAKIRLF